MLPPKTVSYFYQTVTIFNSMNEKLSKAYYSVKTVVVDALTQYTCPEIISWDPISLDFLVYIDAVCRQ